MKVTFPGENLRKIILAPHVSEKSTNAMVNNQHVFRVLPGATRSQVRRAVEICFDVKVRKVNLLNMAGKRKGTGRHRGRRVHWKKAYVALQPGHSINLTGSD